MHESLELIKHRGPDSSNTWISEDCSVVLGHVRLAIIDLSTDGCQPLHDTEDTVHAVVNGELYDYEKIREELIRDFGYQFKSKSDSEIVVALYKYYGVNFLSRLRGEFSICLYDSVHRHFIAARDRFGIKPLFYTIANGRLLVAAEIKAFLPLGWQAEWDVKSLMDQGWSNDERAVFKGVRKLRPGQYLTVDVDTGHLEHRQYWDIQYPDKHVKDPRSAEEMVLGVRERLLEAIRLRLRADVPVGVFLSGGIDSSVIAGMVTHLVKERGEQIGNETEKDRVCCFSIKFDDDEESDHKYDEMPIAERTAAFLGVNFQSVHMTEAVLAENFEEAVWHCEHYFSDLNVIGKKCLAKATTDAGFKVVLTGEGADEHFGGYPLYQADFLREPDLTTDVVHKLSEEERVAKLVTIEKENEAEYIRIGGNTAGWHAGVARRMLNNIITPAYMTAFTYQFYEKWTSELGQAEAMLTVANNANGVVRDTILNKWHPLHSAQYLWSKGHLSSIFLSCLGDRVEMAHSLEARTPFLDHPLAEYVNSLPPSVKIKAGEDQVLTEKWVLREAARPFITDEIYKRRKHPYSAPILYKRDGPIHKVVSKILTRENVEGLGFADWNKAERFLHEAFEEQSATAMRQAFAISQLIILGQRFKVPPAQPRKRMTNGNSKSH